jgi:hypothetical protein
MYAVSARSLRLRVSAVERKLATGETRLMEAGLRRAVNRGLFRLFA